jgi:hypothetical protein
MASGHAYRVNRPNTWLLRPMLQSEDSSCQPGAVHPWPIATFPCAAKIWSLSGHCGHDRTCCWLDPVANDPSRHFAAPQHGVAFGVKRTVEEMTATKQAMAENRLEDVPTDTVGQEPNACAKSCQAPTAR